MSSFKHFSANTARIISSTQPVFGIILAFLFLNETPTLNTFLGGFLILATVRKCKV
ncbi:EamA family transporter [Mariniflexile sp. HNIBRBA6329]|uniref:EamA family transporter n=1 Tax=Mariniflexile sp. HNIBRBA6329 TaxID=3373088 RepID=UPI0037456675